MSKEEKILLGIALAALAAVVLWNQRSAPVAFATGETDPTSAVTEIGMSLTPSNTNVGSGPSYLSYNTPWAFAPPVFNFLPSITAGQGNQTVNMPTDFAKQYSDCGC